MQSNDYPAWYDLGVSHDKQRGVCLLFMVHRAVLESELYQQLKPELEVVGWWKQRLVLPDFISPVDNTAWGYGEVMRLVPNDRPDWITWECALPTDPNVQGGASRIDVSATIAILENFLFCFEGETGESRLQLVRIDGWNVSRANRGNGLTISVSPQMCRWFATLPHEVEHQQITKIMKAAYTQMNGHLNHLEGYRCHARSHDGKMTFTAPENDACWLLSGDRPSPGLILGSHNVDSSKQRLTLFTGICMACQCARADGF